MLTSKMLMVLKRVLNVVYFKRALFFLNQGKNIETALGILYIVLHQVALGNFAYLLLFGRSDGLLWESKIRVAPCLDLDEDKNVPFTSDDIDFSSEKTEFPGQDFISFFYQIA